MIFDVWSRAIRSAIFSTARPPIRRRWRRRQARPSAQSRPRMVPMPADDDGRPIPLQEPVRSRHSPVPGAAQLAPTNGRAARRWSRALAWRGQLSEALDRAQQASQRAPADAEAQAQYARMLCVETGQLNDALAFGEQAMSLDGKNATLRAYLAEIYLRCVGRVKRKRSPASAATCSPERGGASSHGLGAYSRRRAKRGRSNEWARTVALEPTCHFAILSLGR